jgi:hypothetical protein
MVAMICAALQAGRKTLNSKRKVLSAAIFITQLPFYFTIKLLETTLFRP